MLAWFSGRRWVEAHSGGVVVVVVVVVFLVELSDAVSCASWPKESFVPCQVLALSAPPSPGPESCPHRLRYLCPLLREVPRPATCPRPCLLLYSSTFCLLGVAGFSPESLTDSCRLGKHCRWLVALFPADLVTVRSTRSSVSPAFFAFLSPDVLTAVPSAAFPQPRFPSPPCRTWQPGSVPLKLPHDTRPLPPLRRDRLFLHELSPHSSARSCPRVWSSPSSSCTVTSASVALGASELPGQPPWAGPCCHRWATPSRVRPDCHACANVSVRATVHTCVPVCADGSSVEKIQNVSSNVCLCMQEGWLSWCFCMFVSF